MAMGLPAQLPALLASGRPLIAQVDGGELAAATRRCGILVPPGDGAAMVEAIIDLATDPVRRRRLGEVARQLAEEHLERAAILARYEQRLRWVISTHCGGRGRARRRAGVADRLIGRTPAELRRG
jgi:colanic acid biosynthesis glycosyl transferase WcaI